MSTRLNKHKMCTKGSFIFFNHVHSYMELPTCINLFPLIPACTGRPGLPLSAPDIAFLASPSRRLKRLQRRQPSPIAIAILHIQSCTHKTMTPAFEAACDYDHK